MAVVIFLRLKMDKKKIILIGAIPPPYHGTNISNERILNSKIKNTFELYHLDISDHRDLDNLGKMDLVNVLLSLKNFFRLFILLLKVKPDIAYLVAAQNLAYLRDGIFILIVYIFSKAKIVIHLRSSYFKKYYDKSNWFIKKFIDLSLRKVNTAIVLGNSIKPMLCKWIKNIEVVPNGTDFNPDITKKNIYDKNSLTVSYLGNLYEFKGIFDLLKAAKIVTETKKDVQFVFGGPWPKKESETRERIFNYIKDNKLENKVIFKGLIPVEEKENFFMETDIFVLPSWSEGHPNVILEAMSAACPVISTKDVGAISETVLDGWTGILVEKKNPDQIASAIIYLVENPDVRLQMGRSGRKRFEENYTLDENIKNITTVFNKTIDKN
jgi:glycosyltransferase involved in cell wall biosynthesis